MFFDITFLLFYRNVLITFRNVISGKLQSNLLITLLKHSNAECLNSADTIDTKHVCD